MKIFAIIFIPDLSNCLKIILSGYFGGFAGIQKLNNKRQEVGKKKTVC